MAKKKKLTFDLINGLLLLFIVTILACVSNFSAALKEPFGSAIVSINIVSTALFIIIWAAQAFMGGRARSKGMLIAILVWWGGGIGLFKLVDIAMSTGSDMLYYIGFYGLLMIVCPTYALVPLSMHILHIDYFTCYPALLVLLLGIYYLGRKQGEKAEAKKQAMKAMTQKVGEKVEDAQKIDEGEIPEAARAAAEAMRAAAAEKAAKEAAEKEQPADEE
ncbi:MAG: hypothetical protein IJY02_06550 [Oscillospiraceae bacterium]|nr:hypothetical protein [Oscillospiraceae bacterium]